MEGERERESEWESSIETEREREDRQENRDEMVGKGQRETIWSLPAPCASHPFPYHRPLLHISLNINSYKSQLVGFAPVDAPRRFDPRGRKTSADWTSHREPTFIRTWLSSTAAAGVEEWAALLNRI